MNFLDQREGIIFYHHSNGIQENSFSHFIRSPFIDLQLNYFSLFLSSDCFKDNISTLYFIFQIKNRYIPFNLLFWLIYAFFNHRRCILLVFIINKQKSMFKLSLLFLFLFAIPSFATITLFRKQDIPRFNKFQFSTLSIILERFNSSEYEPTNINLLNSMADISPLEAGNQRNQFTYQLDGYETPWNSKDPFGDIGSNFDISETLNVRDIAIGNKKMGFISILPYEQKSRANQYYNNERIIKIKHGKYEPYFKRSYKDRLNQVYSVKGAGQPIFPSTNLRTAYQRSSYIYV